MPVLQTTCQLIGSRLDINSIDTVYFFSLLLLHCCQQFPLFFFNHHRVSVRFTVCARSLRSMKQVSISWAFLHLALSINWKVSISATYTANVIRCMWINNETWIRFCIKWLIIINSYQADFQRVCVCTSWRAKPCICLQRIVKFSRWKPNQCIDEQYGLNKYELFCQVSVFISRPNVYF